MFIYCYNALILLVCSLVSFLLHSSKSCALRSSTTAFLSLDCGQQIVRVYAREFPRSARHGMRHIFEGIFRLFFHSSQNYFVPGTLILFPIHWETKEYVILDCEEVSAQVCDCPPGRSCGLYWANTHRSSQHYRWFGESANSNLLRGSRIHDQLFWKSRPEVNKTIFLIYIYCCVLPCLL